MSILLSTINAGYSHPAFGLRRLLVNMAELRERTALVEFYRRLEIDAMLDRLLASPPRIVGFSVYIWNVERLSALICALKARRPEITVVLGGPEVSYQAENQEIVDAADYVVRGEGDLAFVDLCRRVLGGDAPTEKFIQPPLPDLHRLADPYPAFDEEDVHRRLLYVETSRGCPFRCEYCLSSLDERVRFFPLDEVRASLALLLDRGGLRFKFIDRTFNLNIDRCLAIMEFFLAHLRPGLEIQFEFVPTRMPGRLREMIRRFPPEILRLEVGVQSFDETVLSRIRRRQDGRTTRETLRFLQEETHAVVHADLIAGLPGEDLAGFARSFDELLAHGPAELQVGILKRLHGAPIGRHDEDWGMVYREQAPYDLLQNGLIPEVDMRRLNRFARYWERIGNSGRFVDSTPLITHQAPSAFFAFLQFSDWLHARLGATHGISLLDLVEGVFAYLTGARGLDAATVASALAADYQRGAERVLPRFLKEPLPRVP